MVGLGRTTDAVLDSRAALIRLMAQIDAAIADGEACWLTITEEREVAP